MTCTTYDVERGKIQPEALDIDYAKALWGEKVSLCASPAVFRPFALPKPVKNLGWLLRHAGEVQTLYTYGTVLFARLDRGFYVCGFNSATVLHKWIRRRCLAHARIVRLTHSEESS